MSLKVWRFGSGISGSEELYSGSFVLLSHDCEFDKPTVNRVLVARVTSLDSVKHDSQYSRRTAFRTIFAAIEGRLYYLKRDVVARATESFSIAEIAMLRDESYTLARGKAKVIPKFIPLADNIRFAS